MGVAQYGRKGDRDGGERQRAGAEHLGVADVLAVSSALDPCDDYQYFAGWLSVPNTRRLIEAILTELEHAEQRAASVCDE